LLGDKPLPSDSRGPWIELIGRAGSPRELQRLFDQVLRRGFNKPAAARALAALNEAARLRSVRPLSGLENIGMIFEAPDPLRKEAIRLAGAWKSAGARMPELVSIAEAQATSGETRQVVFETYAKSAGRRHQCFAAAVRRGQAAGDSQKAALALAALDLNKAAPLAVAVLVATPNETDALELWRVLLNVKGQPPRLLALCRERFSRAAARQDFASRAKAGAMNRNWCWRSRTAPVSKTPSWR